MKIIYVALSLIMVIFVSCQDDTELNPTLKEKLFTFNLDNYTTDSTHHFAIISDRNGEILSYSRLENKLIEFETDLADLPDKINISILNITYFQNNVNYSVNSYLDVKPYDAWNFRKSVNNSSSNAGSVNLNVTNSPSFLDEAIEYTLSAPTGMAGYSAKYNGYSDGGLLNMDFDIFSDPADFMFTVNNYNVGPSYLHIPDAHPNQSYQFDFKEDFRPADQTLEILFPEYEFINLKILGVTESSLSKGLLRGHILSEVQNPTKIFHNFYIGYLDGYPAYVTTWNLVLADKTVHMEKVGAPPTEEDFQVLPNDFTVTNKQFSDYAYTYQGEFDYQYSYWQKNETLINTNHKLSWVVYNAIDAEPNKVLLNFPEEIVNQFPYLENFNPLEYRSSRFIDYQGDSNYEYYLSRLFKNTSSGIVEYEKFTVDK